MVARINLESGEPVTNEGHLKAGMPAPDFQLPDEDGRVWSLEELRGSKVILFFYPADDTPGCTRESCDFRDAQTDLSASGYVTLGVSPQDASSHQAFKAKYSLNFPLLVDAEGEAARAYGVWGEFGEFAGISLNVRRGTFIIDEHGELLAAMYGVSSQGHVDQIRAELGV